MVNLAVIEASINQNFNIMSKIYGLFGAMSGKLADVVMSVRNGQQIVRKYQPIVSNPKSIAQTEQRAKFKLMSQIATVFAPVIAMPRMAMQSSRNIFVKENIGNATVTDGEANIPLVDIKLTKSVVSLPDIVASNTAGSVSVALDVAATGLSRVVYVFMKKTADNELRYESSLVVSTPGVDAKYAGSITLGTAQFVVYAYGVRDNTENARVIFGNLETPTAETVAKLVASRRLLESDITVTETRAALVASPV